MKNKFFCFALVLSMNFICEAKQQSIDESDKEFFKNKTPYQDIFVNGEIIATGTNICAPRYELIKPILEKFENNFSVLDIGAAQGYFSFRIAHEFPNSNVVMIEGEDVYKHTKGSLLKLCHLNNHLINIVFFNTRLKYSDVQLINKHCHFDVVLAFLVLHQIQEQISEGFIVLLEETLKLGDHVIIELSDNVYPNLLEIMKRDPRAEFLGVLKRTHSPGDPGLGYFFYYQMKSTEKKEQDINILYKNLNGIYPTNISNKIRLQ